MGRTRVGFLITELQLGGAEKAVALIARGLPRDEFDVSVACLFGPEPYGSVLEAAGIPVTDLRMSGPTDVRVVARCRAWIQAQRLQILHAYLFHASMVSRLARTRRAGWLLLNSQRLSGMERTLRQLANRFTSGRVDQFTAISEDTKRYLRREIGIPGKRIEVIRNGLDLDAFDAEARAGFARGAALPATDDPRIVTLGQMRSDGQKGYPMLVEMMRMVLAARPAHLFACGDGPMRPDIEAAAQRAGVAGSVSFLGERRDVPSVLRDVDIYVQGSLWEGFPNAILEAMAAGLPVVATAVGGVPELVEDGETGVLVPPNDPRAMADVVLALIEDPDLARRLGEAGRQRVEEHFSAERVIQGHVELYRRLIDSGTHGIGGSSGGSRLGLASR